MVLLIDRYLIREIVPYVLIALLVLTAIIFAHDASRFAELLVVASRNGLPMEGLGRVIGALVPGILVFTLPISLLVGTLVGLSRLSGDSEIVALGASGVSRTRVLRPVIALALVIASLMLYITFNILPYSVQNLNELKNNPSLVVQGLNTQIKPGVFEESLPKKVLYVEDIDRANNVWRNIFLVDRADDRGSMRILTAASGSLRQGARSDTPELYLQNGAAHQFGGSHSSRQNQPAQNDVGESDDEDSAGGETSTSPSTAVNDESPTPTQPRERERRKNKNQSFTTAQRFEEMTLGLEVSNGNDDAALAETRTRSVKEMAWSELLRFVPPEGDYNEWQAEIHKRVALPAACVVFALLGVGFGITNVRTGRSFGLLLGLAITIIYYLLAMTGEHGAVSGNLPAWLGIWMANFVLAVLGVVVLLVQKRPGSDPLSLLRSLQHRWPLRKRDEKPSVNERSENGDAGRPSSRTRSVFSPQLIDKLVLSDLVKYFLFILGGFSALFIIITLFQLLEYITRNNIEWPVVVNYLVFLLPYIANNMIPAATLVAVMVTFGVLQKSSQVIALKASGQSVFRLALPVLLVAVFLSGLMFLNQDYVLPFTNRRQNNLRYQIRRGQEPPQTFYQTTNQWIFGSNSRIYNYAHFEPTANVFAQLNLLDLSRDPFGIKRRLYARRARWDGSSREWVLENGWVREFEGERLVSYEPFDQRRVTWPETPDYFRKDFRGSSSMTLAELGRKISQLSTSGFDVVDLKVAFQAKIAFPLTCFIMVIVGLPFSFSVGKRGALYGVTLGIAIGLGYWGMLGLFEQMGRYEMLPPVLAAWGPNLLFGAAGTYLFLTSRT